MLASGRPSQPGDIASSSPVLQLPDFSFPKLELLIHDFVFLWPHTHPLSRHHPSGNSHLCGELLPTLKSGWKSTGCPATLVLCVFDEFVACGPHLGSLLCPLREQPEPQLDPLASRWGGREALCQNMVQRMRYSLLPRQCSSSSCFQVYTEQFYRTVLLSPIIRGKL